MACFVRLCPFNYAQMYINSRFELPFGHGLHPRGIMPDDGEESYTNPCYQMLQAGLHSCCDWRPLARIAGNLASSTWPQVAVGQFDRPLRYVCWTMESAYSSADIPKVHATACQARLISGRTFRKNAFRELSASGVELSTLNHHQRLVPGISARSSATEFTPHACQSGASDDTRGRTR
jgi:hypothetical protein